MWTWYMGMTPQTFSNSQLYFFFSNKPNHKGIFLNQYKKTKVGTFFNKLANWWKSEPWRFVHCHLCDRLWLPSTFPLLLHPELTCPNTDTKGRGRTLPYLGFPLKRSLGLQVKASLWIYKALAIFTRLTPSISGFVSVAAWKGAFWTSVLQCGAKCVCMFTKSKSTYPKALFCLSLFGPKEVVCK